ncbi:DUF3095 domain-containing protein [Falsiphaeobacter marinintestinus]|uniref:DUF3095 domain-containing protein n=1 Tax=Falsiphaeobacter marinintestinus TaxID=1492905 RepID=UPI0011B36EDF|nr:DUF3095 domain-containing protein [Phaeobacter marinintestinus]
MFDDDNANFYDSLPRVQDFSLIAAKQGFSPLPAGWVIGTADIVASTTEIERGRYKTINMIGASIIAAMTNAMKDRDFPFVFGGDGASFAVPASHRQVAHEVLATLRRWVATEFGLELRAALVSVEDIRANGLDVQVARYAASAGVDYAMFSGGGLAWAEAAMKAGKICVDPAQPGTLPDLEGLSCRWSNVRARNGRILSLVVQPVPGADEIAVSDILRGVADIAASLARDGHPVPASGPGVAWPPPGLNLEARASRGRAALLKRQIQLLAGNLLAWGFFRTGLKAGDFDPVHYKYMVGQNTDFRKLDDGLKMTLDCDDQTAERIETYLAAARIAGLVRFGLFAQDEAMLTCFVPSVTEDTHVHFVDGASGGYASAAALLA